MADYQALAAAAYAYAERHYGDKDARFDVIVECMSKSEIAEQLEEARIRSESGAIKWAKRQARGQHEQELNQAWDGPESVKSSSLYDPAHDAAGPPCPACGKPDCDHECPAMDKLMAPDFVEHRDSYTGYPHYSAVSDRARRLMAEEYDDSDAPPYGNMF
jgi:hypothetical protein